MLLRLGTGMSCFSLPAARLCSRSVSLAGGRVSTQVSVTASPSPIFHRLDRPITGLFPGRRRGPDKLVGSRPHVASCHSLRPRRRVTREAGRPGTSPRFRLRPTKARQENPSEGVHRYIPDNRQLQTGGGVQTSSSAHGLVWPAAVVSGRDAASSEKLGDPACLPGFPPKLVEKILGKEYVDI